MVNHLDDTILQIRTMNRKDVLKWQEKAHAALAKSPDNPDAKRLETSIDARLDELDRQSLMTVGLVSWQPYNQHGCAGFVDGSQVAWIHVEGNHTATRKDVYVVEVLGKALPDRYTTIEAARAAGSEAYAQKSAATS